MPAISKLRMTDAGGSRSISERFARVRARPRRACNPALSTRMSSARSMCNSSAGANALTASVNRGAVEKSRSPVSRTPLASSSCSISSPDATGRTFPDSAFHKRGRRGRGRDGSDPKEQSATRSTRRKRSRGDRDTNLRPLVLEAWSFRLSDALCGRFAPACAPVARGQRVEAAHLTSHRGIHSAVPTSLAIRTSALGGVSRGGLARHGSSPRERSHPGRGGDVSRRSLGRLLIALP
jgi:hypothetical protein